MYTIDNAAPRTPAADVLGNALALFFRVLLLDAVLLSNGRSQHATRPEVMPPAGPSLRTWR